MTTTPTIGRVVIYRHSDEDDPFEKNGAEECPAVIVRVLDDGRVSLRLLPDGGAVPHVVGRTMGRDKGQWRWPDIVARIDVKSQDPDRWLPEVNTRVRDKSEF